MSVLDELEDLKDVPWWAWLLLAVLFVSGSLKLWDDMETRRLVRQWEAEKATERDKAP